MCSGSVGEEIGTQPPGALQSLVVAPLVNFGLMAGEENVGDTPAVVVGGTAVDGRCEQIVLKRVAERALLIAYGSGD